MTALTACPEQLLHRARQACRVRHRRFLIGRVFVRRVFVGRVFVRRIDDAGLYPRSYARLSGLVRAAGMATLGRR